MIRSLIAFVLASLLVGCGDDGAPPPSEDAGMDAGPASLDSGALPDAGAPLDAGAVDAGPSICPEGDLGSATGLDLATGTTVGATDDITPGCTGGGADATLRWEAPADGTWVIDTLGSDYDTVLTVLAGDCAGEEMICVDDSGGPQSRAAVSVTAGEVLIIGVDGFAGQSGAYTLSITQPPGEETDCIDGVDDDRDGFLDCADPACFRHPTCYESDCGDGIDNDGDEDLDCADDDCTDQPACSETLAECGDGSDNDSDGDTDCADEDCAGFLPCVEDGAECGDGSDNDGDGDTDCADADCGAVGACDTCPDGDLGAATGAAVTMGSNASASHHRAGSCFDPTSAPGNDLAFRFTAPSDGVYTFDTVGSDYDTLLYVRDGGCSGAELACNDDIDLDASNYQSTVDVVLTTGQAVMVVLDSYSALDVGSYVLNIASTSASFGSPSGVGQLLITEIMQAPIGAGVEWFEVLNNTAAALDLAGCRVFDAGSDSFAIAGTLIVPARQRVVLAAGGTSRGPQPRYTYGGSMTLDDATDEIAIECGSPATTIDRVDFDTAAGFPTLAGHSMSLSSGLHTHFDNDRGSSWCVTPLSEGPYDGENVATPGAENPECR